MATETTKITYAEGSAPATPAAAKVETYAKADGLMYSKDDAGVETLMSGGAGGGSVATDTIWDAAGDLVRGTGANTASRLALGTAGQVLKVNSGATNVEWGAAAGGISGSILVPSSDTYIDSQSATTNNDGDDVIAVGNAWGTASFTRFMLFTLDTSALAGKTIYKADLVLVRFDNTAAGATGRRLEVRRCLRAYVPTEVTWNIYSTGNNWGTAGALNATDVSPTADGGVPVGASNPVPSVHEIPIGWLLKESLAAAETTFRIIVGANVDGASSNAIWFCALENATASRRPFMRVIHS